MEYSTFFNEMCKEPFQWCNSMLLLTKHHCLLIGAMYQTSHILYVWQLHYKYFFKIQMVDNEADDLF